MSSFVSRSNKHNNQHKYIFFARCARKGNDKMASSGDSSEEEDDSHFDYVINALYAEVIAREECGSHGVIIQERQILEGRECESSQHTTAIANCFQDVLRDLELSILRQIPVDNYVQLRFMSSDLSNPFIVPVVKSGMFDARVASKMFTRILPSNSEVDVGRGDFSVDVYTRTSRKGEEK